MGEQVFRCEDLETRERRVNGWKAVHVPYTRENGFQGDIILSVCKEMGI